jgi:hypothetical protein
MTPSPADAGKQVDRGSSSRRGEAKPSLEGEDPSSCPDPFDLAAWRAHRDRVRRLLEEDPTDEGYKASLRRAEFTVADIEGSSV